MSQTLRIHEYISKPRTVKAVQVGELRRVGLDNLVNPKDHPDLWLVREPNGKSYKMDSVTFRKEFELFEQSVVGSSASE